MTSLKERLWLTLEDLREEEFKQLKWILQQADIMHTIIPHLEVYPAIPAARLEKTDRQDTVVQMVQFYGLNGALEVTRKLFIKINRNDLVQQLPDITSAPRGITSWEIKSKIVVDQFTYVEAFVTFLSCSFSFTAVVDVAATLPHLVSADSQTEGKAFV